MKLSYKQSQVLKYSIYLLNTTLYSQLIQLSSFSDHMDKNMKKGNQSQIPSRAIFSIKFQVKVFGLVIGSTGKKYIFLWVPNTLQKFFYPKKNFQVKVVFIYCYTKSILFSCCAICFMIVQSNGYDQNHIHLHLLLTTICQT